MAFYSCLVNLVAFKKKLSDNIKQIFGVRFLLKFLVLFLVLQLSFLILRSFLILLPSFPCFHAYIGL